MIIVFELNGSRVEYPSATDAANTGGVLRVYCGDWRDDGNLVGMHAKDQWKSFRKE